MLASFALSSAAIFLAELGDKSQLLAMSFATRYRIRHVLLGITLATAVVHALSVALGLGLGAALPTDWIGIFVGVAFLGFAAWTVRGDELYEEETGRTGRRAAGSALLAVGTAFLLAELGDKTMLATVTLATQHDWFGTWVGSTVGMVLADALAVVAGLTVSRYLPERLVRYGAAVLFAVFGTWLIVSGLVAVG
ncbi:TMEM165/GDT1 family protein [Actinopolyspora mortivallis]|uniref:TMEM165/GDT1 family protein n=1 Tax=Actinopolyspora mortivallis TaxID=33906 RepID=UPI0003A702E4|nr:TMEM165/GDT1 family protein [Actinopolyspora mortivallis]